jgi:hypothetical protein
LQQPYHITSNGSVGDKESEKDEREDKEDGQEDEDEEKENAITTYMQAKRDCAALDEFLSKWLS